MPSAPFLLCRPKFCVTQHNRTVHIFLKELQGFTVVMKWEGGVGKPLLEPTVWTGNVPL